MRPVIIICSIMVAAMIFFGYFTGLGSISILEAMSDSTINDNNDLQECELFFDPIYAECVNKNSNSKAANLVALENKLKKAGIIVCDNYTDTLLYEGLCFSEKNLFLTYGELTALFNGVIKKIKPPYTEVIEVENYNINKKGDKYFTHTLMSIDVIRLLEHIDLNVNSVYKLYFEAELVTKFDSDGKIHCSDIEINTLNININNKTIDYALTAVFDSKDYESIIYLIYENLYANLGYIGYNGCFGEVGITATGVNIITRRAEVINVKSIDTIN